MQQAEQVINWKTSRLVTGSPDTLTTVPTYILTDCSLSPICSTKNDTLPLRSWITLFRLFTFKTQTQFYDNIVKFVKQD
jgi:hypothetical protein